MAIEALLYDFGLIIFVALILGALVQRLGQSPVLGYLIAGLLLGPSGLHAIASTEFITALSEIGMILLLFYIGLELRPSRLKAFGLQALLMGSVKMVVGFGAAFVVAYALGFRGIEAAVLGAVFAISSTTVVMKILMDRGETKRFEAQLAEAILIFEGIVAIVFIAYLANAAQTTTVIANTLLFMFLALFIGAKISGRLLRLIERLGHEKYVTVYAFGVLLLMSWITATLQLSTITGAFFAGFLLSETVHAKTIYREMDLLKNMLVAVFFASIGLSITGFVLGPVEIIGILASVALVLFVKDIAFYLFGHVAGIHRTTYLSLLLVPLGEFSLLFLQQAEALHLTHVASIATISIGAVLLTTALMPLLLRRESAVDRFIKFFIPDRVEATFDSLGKQTGAIFREIAVNPQFQRRFSRSVQNIILNLVAIAAIIYFLMILQVTYRGAIIGAILLLFPLGGLALSIRSLLREFRGAVRGALPKKEAAMAAFVHAELAKFNVGLVLMLLAVVGGVGAVLLHVQPIFFVLAGLVGLGLIGLWLYASSARTMYARLKKR